MKNSVTRSGLSGRYINVKVYHLNFFRSRNLHLQLNPNRHQTAIGKLPFMHLGLIPLNMRPPTWNDEYWRSVDKMKDEKGQLKYPQLLALVKCVLPISHANIILEPGFSINKYLLSIHSTSTSNETIIAWCLVKDFILVGGYMKFSVNKNLILSVKTATQISTRSRSKEVT